MAAKLEEARWPPWVPAKRGSTMKKEGRRISSSTCQEPPFVETAGLSEKRCLWTSALAQKIKIKTWSCCAAWQTLLPKPPCQEFPPHCFSVFYTEDKHDFAPLCAQRQLVCQRGSCVQVWFCGYLWTDLGAARARPGGATEKAPQPLPRSSEELQAGPKPSHRQFVRAKPVRRLFYQPGTSAFFIPYLMSLIYQL